MIIGDLETDNLYPEVSVIHCASFYDTKTGQVVTFIPDHLHISSFSLENERPLSKLPDFMDTLPVVSFHNWYGFDKKVLKKILGYEYKGKVYDTLMMSRILYPDIESEEYEGSNSKKEKHSVGAWAKRLGLKKVEHNDWSSFSLEMLHRCVEDTKIQGAIYTHCAQKMREYAENNPKIKGNWQKILDLEHEVWDLIEKQADYGWLFDLESAFRVCSELERIIKSTENKLLPVLPPKVVQVSKTESGATRAFKANGTYTQAHKDWVTQNNIDGFISGDFCKVRFEEFNLGSSQQVKDYLTKYGWVPTEWNYKRDPKYKKIVKDENGKPIRTSPKTPSTAEEWSDIAEKIGNEDIKLLAEYNKASHRLSQVRGLIERVRSDHRIEAQANTCSTNTARMAHRGVVNIPKASDKVYYGKELRSLFIVPEGRVLVGCDAASLEARCAAHYIHPYDPDYANELIYGDVHTENANAWGVDRNTAKSGIYGLLYGCSAGRFASILGCPFQQAKALYDEFWRVKAGLNELKHVLEAEYNKYGYIVAIDGRPLTIRYKHAILNTLLQSTGAIAMKKAFATLMGRLRMQDAYAVGNFHDEYQLEVADTYSFDGNKKVWYPELIGKAAVKSIQDAGEQLGFNVPLDGEYKVGKNWSLTH